MIIEDDAKVCVSFLENNDAQLSQVMKNPFEVEVEG